MTLELHDLKPCKVLAHLQELTPIKKILVAYSGGLDSHVLLHLASQFPDYEIRAMHIHHGLQKVADTWVGHCQQVCDDLKTPLHVEYLKLNINEGKSVEELARNARYKTLKEYVQKDEILLTAHHQNDQAETLLLQLFRGAGVQGLAAMPSITSFGLGQHARPLLGETRESLEAYAKANELNFIEDPSNQDSAFDRNFLRNEILPSLRSRWSSIDKTISRSANIQAETKQILDEVAEQDLRLLCTKQLNTLSLSALSSLSLLRQKLAIRYWIGINGFMPPSEKKLKHIFNDAIDAAEDAQPLIEWRSAQIRRYQGELYIMAPLMEHDATQIIEWNTQYDLMIPSLKLTLPALNLNEKEVVTVRFRRGGEKFFQSKNGLHSSLKKLLQDASIPPWLRSRIPLVYLGDKLIRIELDE